MNFNLQSFVFNFLKSRLNNQDQRPVMLGLSGGPDSLALAHILWKLSSILNLKIHLAHVDHGWRSESSCEAESLASLAREWEVPFHLSTLNPHELSANLECACREKRLAFFQEIYTKHNCQALLLAHHSLDQCETVLKKLFEGVSLPYLDGIVEEKSLMGMLIWRPFIKIQKDHIENYIKEFDLKPFYDKTNFDPKFLRSRMRTTLFPLLNAHFGKNITTSLLQISQESQELKEFLNSHLLLAIDQIEIASHCSFLDFNNLKTCSPLEIKYLLKKLADTQNQTLSHSLIKDALKLIIENTANKQLISKGLRLEIDRGRVFLFSKPLPQLKMSQTQAFFSSHSSWRQAWKGEGVICLADGENYRLEAARLNSRCLGGKSLDKWWTEYKIPAFLRNSMPVIYCNDTVVHEFLTGIRQTPPPSKGILIRISPVL